MELARYFKSHIKLNILKFFSGVWQRVSCLAFVRCRYQLIAWEDENYRSRFKSYACVHCFIDLSFMLVVYNKYLLSKVDIFDEQLELHSSDDVFGRS